MASTDEEESCASQPETERTPLLNNSSNKPNGVVASGDSSEAGAGDGAAKPPVGPSVVVEFSTAKTFSIMLVVWFGTALSAIDATVISTLSASISSSFQSLTLLGWLASSYIIASATVLPVIGKLTDIFGRRAGLLASNTFFTVGNLICGLAPSEAWMLTGRVIAGLGGGGLNALSTVIASDLVPLRRRGVWQGYGNFAWGFGSALGSVAGGWLNDAVGWRWAFLIMVPLTVVSGIAVFFLVDIPVKETDGSKIKRVDFPGALSLVTSLVVLLVGLNAGGNTVPWNHPLVLVSIPLSLVLFSAFVYIEARVAVEPIIPLSLLRNRTVLASCMTVCFATMAYYSLIFYVPLYLQIDGLTATQTGIRSLPNAFGIAVGSFSTGALMSLTGHYWWLNLAVEFILVLGFALVSTFDLGSPPWMPFVYTFVASLGFAGMLTTTMIALIAAVDHAYQAVVTSACYTFRMTGGVTGIALSSVVFQNVFGRRLEDRLGDTHDADWIIPKIRDSLDYLSELPPELRTEAVLAYMDALKMVFVTMLCLAFAAGVTSLFMREHKLHKNISRSE